MLKNDLSNKLKKISEFLYDYNEEELDTIGIRYGKLGIALFLLIYSDYSKEYKYQEKANILISNVINDILKGNLANKRPRENLVDFGRFMEFVNKHEIYKFDTNIFLDDFDTLMYSEMRDLLEIGDYDVVDGALSMGYYFILRYNSNSNISEYLSYLIKGIYKLSRKDENNNLYWVSTLFEGDRIYLGVHGSSQIILFCIKLLELNIEKELCLLIINMASSYIYDNKIENPVAYFPIVVNQPVKRGSLEWAYGDLQVSYSLYKAGEILDIQKYKKIAIKSYDLAASRIMEEEVVVDAGLVHGITGTGLMFLKMNILLNSDKYLNAVNQCNLRLLKDFFNSESPFLSYSAKYEIDVPGSHVSFISGLAGIGIYLITINTNKYIYFDELLFM